MIIVITLWYVQIKKLRHEGSSNKLFKYIQLMRIFWGQENQRFLLHLSLLGGDKNVSTLLKGVQCRKKVLQQNCYNS